MKYRHLHFQILRTLQILKYPDILNLEISKGVQIVFVRWIIQVLGEIYLWHPIPQTHKHTCISTPCLYCMYVQGVWPSSSHLVDCERWRECRVEVWWLLSYVALLS